MKIKSLLLGTVCSMLLLIFSCKREDFKSAITTDSSISPEILALIQKRGFKTDNVKKVDGGYLVEGDIKLTAKNLSDTSTHGRVNLVVATTEQYSVNTNYLVSGLPRTITITTDNAPQNYLDQLDLAISRWNSAGLSITFQRVSNGSADILVHIYSSNNDNTNGFSNLPQNNNPYNRIDLNSYYLEGQNGNNVSPNFIASTIQHEMGHCVGLMHTDYYLVGNSTPEGAFLIPGTPSKPDDTSLMLAVNGGADRSFNNNDLIAINYIYGAGTNLPNEFYRFRGSSKYHFYSFRYNEGILNGYIYEGVLGKLYTLPFSGTVPLYRYRSSDGDYLYQTNYANISGYSYEGTVGYVFNTQVSGSVPIYRFSKPYQGHFYTSSYNEGINAGLNYEGIGFYLLN